MTENKIIFFTSSLPDKLARNFWREFLAKSKCGIITAPELIGLGITTDELSARFIGRTLKKYKYNKPKNATAKRANKKTRLRFFFINYILSGDGIDKSSRPFERICFVDLTSLILEENTLSDSLIIGQVA